MNNKWSEIISILAAIVIALTIAACGGAQHELSQDAQQILSQPTPIPPVLIPQDDFEKNIIRACDKAVEDFNRAFSPTFTIPDVGISECKDAVVTDWCFEKECEWPGPKVDPYGVSDGYRAAQAATDQLQTKSWIPFAQGVDFIRVFLNAMESIRTES